MDRPEHRIIASGKDMSTHEESYALARQLGLLSSVGEHELLRAVVQASPIPLYVVDQSGDVMLWNPAAEQLFGWSEAEVLGSPLPFVSNVQRSEYDRLRLGAFYGEGFTGVEAVRFDRSGNALELSLSTVPLRGVDGRPIAVLGVANDVTRERRAMRELDVLAHFDELTGIANRRSFLAALDSGLAEHPENVSVAYLDLDGFKDVNDSFGHVVGDQLLKAFARRLERQCRSDCVIGRVGGDEFAVMLMGSTPDQALSCFERLVDVLTDRIDIDGQQIMIRPSAGIAHGTCGDNASKLLQRADLALYHVKRYRLKRVCRFDVGMLHAAQRRLELSDSLRHAIEDDQLVVAYQPIVSLQSLEIVGLEALVRWNHPSLGLLGPDRFISEAEETGLIVALGDWVFHRVCRDAAVIDARCPQSSLTFGVNVSGLQVGHEELADRFLGEVHAAGLATARFQLELTETALAADPEQAGRTLSALSDAGFGLALDDFGTGYSSLTMLRRYPFGVLKIDRSFVGGLGSSVQDESITAATISLAHSLGLRTVAEGVETDCQVRFLRQSSCDELQGYLLSKPLWLEQLMAFVTQTPGSSRRFGWSESADGDLLRPAGQLP
jgi:diguanylate cyclase (GGDEF)-like protein/PAS domain S-box-containing protein